MSQIKEFCERCGRDIAPCDLERQTPPPRDLLSVALFRLEYPFFDLYAKPPVYGDGWTGDGELREGKTKCDVAARIEQLKAQIQWHGRRNGWGEDRIAAAIEESAYPMRDRSDPVLNCYDM